MVLAEHKGDSFSSLVTLIYLHWCCNINYRLDKSTKHVSPTFAFYLHSESTVTYIHFSRDTRTIIISLIQTLHILLHHHRNKQASRRGLTQQSLMLLQYYTHYLMLTVNLVLYNKYKFYKLYVWASFMRRWLILSDYKNKYTYI